MVKKIIPFVLFAILLASMTYAVGFSSPYPIYGQVLQAGVPLAGVEVAITYDSTGDTGLLKTNQNGYFQEDLPNIYPGWRDGAGITLELPCEDATCIQKRQVEGVVMEVNFAIPERMIRVVTYRCFSGAVVGNPQSCPIISVEDEVYLGLGSLWWMRGFTAMMLALLAYGVVYRKRVIKSVNTVIRKFKSGKYKR